MSAETTGPAKSGTAAAGLRRLGWKLALAALPAIAIVVAYVAWDPFEVLHAGGRHYRDVAVTYNRDFNSTEIFLRNSQEITYDSFIFGSSRSWAFLTTDWRRHIGPRPTFHFDASSESLFGVFTKVGFLNARGVRIRNALLAVDTDLLGKVSNHRGHLFVKHPLLSRERWLDFHEQFLSAYLDPTFLVPFLGYKVLGVPPHADAISVDRFYSVDPVSNDLVMTSFEREILADPDDYYRRHGHEFPEQEPGTIDPPTIRAPQLWMLQHIASVFLRHGTDFRVVLNPRWDQVEVNPLDVQLLRATFGQENVYDLSGVNPLTASMTNYYEGSHFRPTVGRWILDGIYGSRGPAHR